MAKSNIVYRSYRLNLDDEQHRRVNRVLAGLNTDIHKSVNQFITDAVDFYTSSLGNEDLIKGSGERKEKEYLLKSDLAGIREELKDDIKNEIIMLLGAALGGRIVRAAEGAVGRGRAEPVAETEGGAKGLDDPTMTELVDGWG